jgi:CheY-like chemotaxis protein
LQTSPSGDAQLLFSVKDTGIGISAEDIAKLFMPFSQADASSTRKYGGLGLGLAICRSLVEMLGGQIRCESELGKGCTFFFTLPLVPAPASSSGGEGGQPPSGEEKGDFESLRGMRVLLAEDNEINQMIAIELLALKDVAVTVAANGREALEALERERFDLVLMDIQMPVMDGLTATMHLRAMPEGGDLPVIAMTAHALKGDRDISLAGGMNDHITKPIDPDELYAALKRWDRR